MLKGKLKEIIALVEASNVHEVEVSTWWGRKIRVTKNATDLGISSPRATIQAETPVQSPPGEAGPESSGAVKDVSRHHQVQAPIVGTFYRAPSPELPPFINIGDHITAGQVICIIEAMKIMNEIESDVSGTVVDILAENASPVEFNQPLVVVDPS